MMPMSSRRRGRSAPDSGTAALELTLCLLVFFVLVALSAPMLLLLINQTKISRAAGVAARFATQVPDRGRPGSALNIPTNTEIVAEAVQAAQDAGISTSSSGWSTPTVTRVGTGPGSTVSIRLSTVVPLSGFAGILAYVGIVPSSVTLTATAVGRQE